MDAGGTTIVFTTSFPGLPRLTITAQNKVPLPSGILFAVGTFQNRTVAQFDAHVFDTDGVDVGGTIDWNAIYEG